MIRKKIGKQAPKPTQTNAQSVVAAQPPVPVVVKQPAITVNVKNTGQMDKDRIAQLVANKIRQNKKQKQIISKISTQVTNNNRKKFKQYSGKFINTLKITTQNHSYKQRQHQQSFQKTLSQYRQINFKETGYI